MTETPEEIQTGLADAVHGLSDNSRALVRHEITAAQREMMAKARRAWPAAALLGAASLCGMLSAAASYRLSIRLFEKALPPATAALTAATAYGTAAGVLGVLGYQRLRAVQPLFPAETAHETAETVKDTAARAAGG